MKRLVGLVFALVMLAAGTPVLAANLGGTLLKTSDLPKGFTPDGLVSCFDDKRITGRAAPPTPALIRKVGLQESCEVSYSKSLDGINSHAIQFSSSSGARWGMQAVDAYITHVTHSKWKRVSVGRIGDAATGRIQTLTVSGKVLWTEIEVSWRTGSRVGWVDETGKHATVKGTIALAKVQAGKK